MRPGEAYFLARNDLRTLFETLHAMGYACHGPTVRDEAIVFDVITGPEQLPVGVRDEQAPGRYRLTAASGERCFGWANGPQALKPLTFAPHEALWRVVRSPEGQLEFSEVVAPLTPTAVIGVRACDLAALALQEAHFLGDAPRDGHYGRRRDSLLLIAVNCSHPAATCFCASTGDGPAASAGYDLLLDELDEGLILRAGSEAGEAVLTRLDLGSATAEQLTAAARQVEEAATVQQRRLPAGDLATTLFASLEHPRWAEVAERCLSCGNCTAVCPSCFCHHERDEIGLDLSEDLHLREWDSCFTSGHSALHGTPVRGDVRLRYRQWLIHKLGGWHIQYGRSGCVGCGRCISWCPAAIDLTEEVAVIVKGAES